MRRIGSRVKILGGMPEFVGKRGTIVSAERLGEMLYRVRLDEPVNVAGVGMVRDDLWSSEFLGRV